MGMTPGSERWVFVAAYDPYLTGEWEEVEKYCEILGVCIRGIGVGENVVLL